MQPKRRVDRDRFADLSSDVSYLFVEFLFDSPKQREDAL